MEKQPGMGTVARVLQREMHKRFDRYIADSFESLYIASTLLDPEYSLILSKEQLDEGVCCLKELVKDFIATQVQSDNKTRDEKDITIQENTKELVVEPPLKNFRHLSQLVSKQNSQDKEIASTSEEQEVDLFVQQRKSNPPEVMLWTSGSNQSHYFQYSPR